MSSVELREMNDSDLKGRMEDLAAEHMKLRFQKATMQLTNSARIRQVRRDIARIKTVLASR
ncbi:MAG: 50S ribosomal protein L29 [Zetaproteobacteria bacterium]|nr:50S ribosomal protein L29 [Zetaproteobacteria bacterium]MDQ6952202.1 50S ribosomal protein L29 [Mariprofundaceae bacterium]